jgi:hypothetical protein
MSKMFQVYGIGQALIPVLPPPLPFENPPTINQTNYEIGQLVFSPPQTPTAFYLYAGAGNWVQFASGSGDIIAINGTTSQVTVATVAGTATVSLPAAITAPGSLATTTTLAAGTALSSGTTITAGTSITATLGNITATNGNFVASTAGTGIVLNSGTASGTTAATLNGRSGQITITTPSIAAGATFSFAITNSSITASTTQVGYWLTGGTTGSAITIQSVTNSAGTSTVVVQNASAVTSSTGSLVLTFLVLN